MTRQSRRVLRGVIGVAALAGIVAYNVTVDSNSHISVMAQKAGRRDLVSVVSASGEIKPKRYVNISANVSGRIEQLLIKEGDTVRKGQVLARIDSTRIAAGERQSAAALEGAKADLARADADLEVSRLAFERQKKMHADKLVSDQAYEQADAELKMKTAAVNAQKKRIIQGEALLASNRDDLEKTNVIAPMDGVVTSLPKEEGETVIGAQSFSPTVIMTVADLSVMEVEVMVDETDIRNVRLGQSAEARVDALEGVKIKGEVTEIDGCKLRDGTDAVLRNSKLYKPIIAAVDGPCVAGGMEMLGGIDIRIATPNARFGVMEPKQGLFAGGGTTVRLPQQVGFAAAMEFLLTAEPLPAERALQLGLLNEIVAPEELPDRALWWAGRILANGPLAIRATKESVIRGMEVTMKEAYKIESALSQMVFATEDAKEGPKAFAEKRAANWQNK